MRKKIKLDELKIQSFLTSFDDEKQTLDFKGGAITQPMPDSGPCVKCVATIVYCTLAECLSGIQNTNCHECCSDKGPIGG